MLLLKRILKNALILRSIRLNRVGHERGIYYNTTSTLF